jgi:hypothetical protein
VETFFYSKSFCLKVYSKKWCLITFTVKKLLSLETKNEDNNNLKKRRLRKYCHVSGVVTNNNITYLDWMIGFIDRSFTVTCNHNHNDPQKSLPMAHSIMTGLRLLHSDIPLFCCRLISVLISITVTVRITLRLAVYRQSLRLGDKPLETHGQQFFFSCILAFSHYVTSSLTRGWVFS